MHSRVHTSLLTMTLQVTAWTALGSELVYAGTWNHFKEAEVAYTWKAGDTLSGLLLQQGLGKDKGPLRIYGAHGWLKRNFARNAAVKDWGHLAAGTVIYLVLPAAFVKPRLAKEHLAVKRIPQPPTTAPKPIQLKNSSAAEAATKSPTAAKDSVKDAAAPRPKKPTRVPGTQPAIASATPPDEQEEEALLPRKTPASAERNERAYLLWTALIALCAGGSVAWWQRAQTKGVLRRVHSDLSLSQIAEVYLRTYGQMTTAAIETLDPADDYQRQVKIALIEGLLTARPEYAANVAQYAEALHYFDEVAAMLSMARETDMRPKEKNGQEKVDRSQLASFNHFIDRLAVGQPKLAKNLRELLPQLLQDPTSKEQIMTAKKDEGTAPTEPLAQAKETPAPPPAPALAPTLASADPAAIDTSRDSASITKALTKLTQLGGRELITDLVTSFCATTPSRISLLETATEKADLKTISFEAHALKGASGTLGAIALSGVLQVMERAADAEDMALVQANIKHLTPLFLQTKALLEAFKAQATGEAA